MLNETNQAYGDAESHNYDRQEEHILTADEAVAWLQEIRRLDVEPGARVLDYGAGSGALVLFLRAVGYDAVGLDPSAKMVTGGLSLRPMLGSSDLLTGSAEDGALFGAASFDLVVSRQSLCHLLDPETTFACLHSWLRPGGTVFLVDGHWTGFTVEQKRYLPLAGLSDPREVATRLEGAGFAIDTAETFAALNTARKASFARSTPRYKVTARRT